MHIILKSEESGKVEGVVCVDRATQSCTILQHTEANLDDLVRIAQALKVPKILMFASPEYVLELTSYGWEAVTDPVLMKKEG